VQIFVWALQKSIGVEGVAAQRVNYLVEANIFSLVRVAARVVVPPVAEEVFFGFTGY
tara:strand:- start:645 stop:815 length:171 start_codon:yes stop_codon:yes gene_type:complete